MAGLTQKQDNFCLAYIETGNASEAYRRAYNSVNMKPEVIHVKACELLKSGNVAVRIEELRAQAIKRNEITVDDLVKELDENRKIALSAETPQAAAATAATMGKAKLLGLIVDKQQTEGTLTLTVATGVPER